MSGHAWRPAARRARRAGAALLLLLLAGAASVRAQAGAPPLSTTERGTAPAAPATPGISDNSFLVEEAYNQEAGVVQHILNYRRDRAGEWALSFTQEWPAPSQRHQLSYGLTALSAGDEGAGLGDAMVNYRYQLIGKDEERLWVSPRLSAILPTGSVRAGRGAGGAGVQVSLPASLALGGAMVTHWNAGATLTRARNVAGTRRTMRGTNAAASVIWLLAPTVNLMLETAWDRTESLGDDGAVSANEHFVVLPGVRAAINLASGMQIVPGVGVPIGVGPTRGTRDLFLYLSVEHSFR